MITKKKLNPLLYWGNNQYLSRPDFFGFDYKNPLIDHVMFLHYLHKMNKVLNNFQNFVYTRITIHVDLCHDILRNTDVHNG